METQSTTRQTGTAGVGMAATQAIAEAAPLNQCLTFTLAGETFAVPILAVKEIRGWGPVARTPHAPAYVLGIMDLRGAVVPILDLRVRLGMAACERMPTSVIIVVSVATPTAETVTVGCLVDAVSDVVSLRMADTRPMPTACGTLHTHFVAQMAIVNDQLLMLLDLEKLIVGSNPIFAAGAAPLERDGEISAM